MGPATASAPSPRAPGRGAPASSHALLLLLLLLLLSSATPAAAFVPPAARAAAAAASPRLHASGPPSSSASSVAAVATTPSMGDSEDASWRRLGQLVEAALQAEGDGLGQVAGLAGAVDRDEGAVGRSAGASLADTALLQALHGMRAREGQGGILKYFASVRLEPYKVTRSDVKVYARMKEQLEVCLGFTASPAVERIESGIAVVMAATVFIAIGAVDKLTGVVPDIVRWFITAGLVSLPFAYIALGATFPDTLIASINQVLFALNKEYKERLYRHEAGHFLVGYLVGLPVLKYSVSGRLNAVQFAQVLAPGNRQAQPQPQPPTSMPAPAIGPAPRDAAVAAAAAAAAEAEEGKSGLLTKAQLAQLTAVSLAGVVSEYVRFGNAEGGFNDLAQLQALMDVAEEKVDDKGAEALVNWGTLACFNMLKQHERALVALMAAFERGASVVECIRVIEREGGRYLDDDDDDDA